MKHLIVNADDFGYSRVFNEKILELIERGCISGTSVMVKWINDAQNTQVRRLVELHQTKNVSVGLHVEFSSTLYGQEIDEQWQKFIILFGFAPEHIDFHKYSGMPTEYLSDGYPVITAFSKKFGVPCKNLGITQKTEWMTEAEEFRGTQRAMEEIEAWLATLKNHEYYHVTYHPGTFDPDSKSSLNKEREIDAQKVIQLFGLLPKYGVELASSRDFAAHVRAG